MQPNTGLDMWLERMNCIVHVVKKSFSEVATRTEKPHWTGLTVDSQRKRFRSYLNMTRNGDTTRQTFFRSKSVKGNRE
jgi:hypothetical protein